jgi:DNA-binding PadR family transcriptional regulator
MAGLRRVTAPTLDVLQVFLEAHSTGRRVHGWEIKKATGRSGPTVYSVLDRLQGAGWIDGEWERQDPADNRPRRRLYALTGDAVLAARALLAERRPGVVGFPAAVSPRSMPAPGGTR